MKLALILAVLGFIVYWQTKILIERHNERKDL